MRILHGAKFRFLWFCVSVCVLFFDVQPCFKKQKVTTSQETLEILFSKIKEKECRKDSLDVLEDLVVTKNIKISPEDIDKHDILFYATCDIEDPYINAALLKKLITMDGCNIHKVYCESNSFHPLDTDIRFSYFYNLCYKVSESLLHNNITYIHEPIDIIMLSLRNGINPNVGAFSSLHSWSALNHLLLGVVGQYPHHEIPTCYANLITACIGFGANVNHTNQFGETFEALTYSPSLSSTLTLQLCLYMGAKFFKNSPKELKSLVDRSVKIHDTSIDTHDLFKTALKNSTFEDGELIKLAINLYFYQNEFEKLNMLFDLTEATKKTEYLNPHQLFQKSLEFYTTNPKHLPNQRIAYFSQLCFTESLQKNMLEKRGCDVEVNWK